MSRKTFLTIGSIIAFSIGCFATFAPDVLIELGKHAEPSATANVMARTTGVLLITIGVLNFLVRDHGDSPTMKAILITNIVLQVCILPIDPHAYFTGVYGAVEAFLPNVILHLALLLGAIYYLLKMPATEK